MKAPRDESSSIELPENTEELAKCLADPMWRIKSGIYKILVKGDDEDEGTILNFKPNTAQVRLLERLWHRNLILKARQLGFTTLVCILWLDHALFNSNQRCGIVAHDKDAAGNILRDKVKFAYEHLPEVLRNAMPIKASNASEIWFAHNNSSVRVATSMRSGTIHRLHVSEYGKICAKYPEKADEVMTGSLPSVPTNGVTIIESTAEGQDGDFFTKSQKAQALHDTGAELTPKDFRFHFYAWWQEPKYRLPSARFTFTRTHENYILETEAKIGRRLHRDQWAWYFATKDGELGGSDEKAWREYPSFPEEAFKVSTDGAYYAQQLAAARRDGRITKVPYLTGYPVHTFWDLGLNDQQAIWFMQDVRGQHRFVNYYENAGEGVSHYVRKLQELSMEHGYIYGTHYLPHDGAHQRVTMEKPETYEDMLRKANVRNITIVPRILHLTTGIDMMREQFAQCWFDEKNCAEGLARLQNYKKAWSTRLSCWTDHPREDDNKNGADAIRQYAQGYRGTPAGKARRERKTSWRTA